MTIYFPSFFVIFHHLPSSSIIFPHLPLMEDGPKIKIHRNSTYGYQKRSKDDTRPLSTFSNVHRSSSIVFHHLPKSSIIIH